MRLLLYVRPDGTIQSALAVPEGVMSAWIVPAPGIKVCELDEPNINGADPQQLLRLLKEYNAEVTSARGTLRRKAQTG